MDAIELQVTRTNNFSMKRAPGSGGNYHRRRGPLQCSRNAKQAVSAVKHKKRYVIYFFITIFATKA